MVYGIALFLIIVGHLVDYWSTVYALNYGAHEANPVVRALGLFPSKILFISLTALVLWFMPPLAQVLAATGVFIALFTVALHNVGVIDL